MAYTGILLRGDTYANIVADPPIAREAVVAGEALGLTTIGNNTFYLNVAMLANIGKVDSSGVGANETKTSELPLLFDAGELIIDDTKLTIRGKELLYDHLKEITKVTGSEAILAGQSIKPDVLAKITKALQGETIIDGETMIPSQLSKIMSITGNSITTDGVYYLDAKPTITNITVNDITVDFHLGAKVEVYNHTTSTLLGEITTSGGTLTYGAAQTSGDVIYVWGLDADDNKTLQKKGVTP